MADKHADNALIAQLNRELSRSLGFGAGQLQDAYKKSIDYYKQNATGDLRPPNVPGRSTTVASDVFDTVEWYKTAVVKAFTQTNSICEFVAKKPDFEDAAKQAAEYIGKHVFYVQNDGFNIMQDAFSDALICKNAFLKVWWDKGQEPAKESYKNLSEVALQMLLEDEDVELTKLVPTEMGFDVVVMRKQDKGKVCIEVIPPEDMRVHPRTLDLETSPFVAQRFVKSISELRADGYDVPDDLVSDSSADQNDTDLVHWARRDYEDTDDDSADAENKAMRFLVGYECYYRQDVDGDGIAELRKVTFVNNRILDNVEVDEQPFVTFSSVRIPHEFFGLSVAEMAMESQKTNTFLRRGALDSVSMALNGRSIVVDDQIKDLSELLNARPGGIVRATSIDAVAPLNVNNGDAASAIALIEKIDIDRERKTGLTQYSMGGDTPLISQTATGANILTNRADARIELVCRNFANGFKAAMWKIYKLVCQYDDKPSSIKVKEEWLEVNPREWKDQFTLEVNVGLGASNRMETLNNLTQLSMAMQAAAPLGIIKPINAYNALIKTADTLGFQNPEEFASPPEEQVDPQVQELQQQLEMMGQELQKLNQERDELKLRVASKEAEAYNKAREVDINRELREKELFLEEIKLMVEKEVMLAELNMKDREIDMREQEHIDNRMDRKAEMALTEMGDGQDD